MTDAPGMKGPGRIAPRTATERRRDGAVDTLRRLLASLRDVMAGSGSAQRKLDKIVQLIAAEMGAEVCSCHVLRAGEVLHAAPEHEDCAALARAFGVPVAEVRGAALAGLTSKRGGAG